MVDHGGNRSPLVCAALQKGVQLRVQIKNKTTCTKSGKGYRGTWAGVRRCHHTPHMSPLPVTFSKSLKFGKSN